MDRSRKQTYVSIVALIVISILFVSIGFVSRQRRIGSSSNVLPRQALAYVLMPFIETGADSFSVRTFSGSITAREGGIDYSFFPSKHKGALQVDPVVVSESIPSGVAPIGGVRSPTVVSYFQGRDATRWRSRVPAYTSVAYSNLWNGIDLSIHTRDTAIEKILTLKPHADPAQITFDVKGATLSLKPDGSLGISTDKEIATLSTPLAYQVVRGLRRDVEITYALSGPSSYGFSLGEYDTSLPLIIDPILAGTYIGSSSYDAAYGMSRDPVSGDIYITGESDDVDFPTTPGSFQPTHTASFGYTVLVAQFSSDLSVLKSATYLGGSNGEYAVSVLADGSSAYICGSTNSEDFPVTPGAFQTVFEGDGNSNSDAFVTRLSADLGTLESSTYISTSACQSVARDGSSVYALIDNFDPTLVGTPGSFMPSPLAPGNDAVFVAKLPTDLSTIEASTYLSGSAASDFPVAIAPDGSGNVIVAGTTGNSDFPTTPGALQTAFAGLSDIFISKLSGDLTTLIASTYFGGTDSDTVVPTINTDSSGNIYIGGYTSSTDFPVSSGAYQTSFAGVNDAFVSKLSADLTTLIGSSYVGGADSESAGGFTIDPVGNVYVGGLTSSADFPVTPGAFQTDTITDPGFAAGKVQEGILFSGSGGISEPLGGSITDQFTLDAWVNEHFTTGGFQRYVSLQGNVFSVGPEASIRIADDTIQFFAFTTDGLKVVNDVAPMALNQFVHIAGVFNGTAGTMELYVDGVLVASDSFPPGTTMGEKVTALPASPTVGHVGIIEPANAVVDEAEIFNRALDITEIQDIIAADGAGKCKTSPVPGCTPPPADLINWFPGDGNFDDETTGAPTDVSSSLRSQNFIAKISPDFTTLLGATYLGGATSAGYEDIYGLVSDSGGNLYVAGDTGSLDFPVTAGAFDTTQNDGGVGDAFVAYINCNLTGGLACATFDPPTLSTAAASSVDATGAVLNGSIDDIGSGNATERGFVYGVTNTYGATTTESGSFSTGVFSRTLSGLSCNSTYHFAAYAINTAGLSYASDVSFATSACATPSGGGQPVGSSPTAPTLQGVSTIRGSNVSGTVLIGENGLGGGGTTTTGTSTTLVEKVPAPKVLLDRDLQLHDVDSDVLKLQKFLNVSGFPVALTGPGSIGFETLVFGFKTLNAVMGFQAAKDLPPTGYVGPLTRSVIKATR